MSTPKLAPALMLCLVLSLGAATAEAQTSGKTFDPPSEGLAYGFMMLGPALVGSMATIFAVGPEEIGEGWLIGGGLAVTFGVPIGTGVAAGLNDWPMSPAIAGHLGFWTGASGFALGALYEDEIGPWALAGGALGFATGAVLGWTARVETLQEQMWMMAPPGAAMGTLVLMGVIAPALFMFLDDDGARIAFSAVPIAGLIGSGLAATAFHRIDDKPTTLLPELEEKGSSGAVMLTLIF